MIETFRFPKINETPIIAPTKGHTEIILCFRSQYEAILLIYVATELRESGLLSLKKSDIDPKQDEVFIVNLIVLELWEKMLKVIKVI